VKLLQRAGTQKCSPKLMALGYSLRQCQRWFPAYRETHLSGLLARGMHERGP
jgi:hypothetical protein